MASYSRRDDFVLNAIGYAVPNIAVTYYTQPGLTLATVYNDANGDEAIGNPQYTDGFGHAVAYMASGLYTITYSGPQIQTFTLPDQDIGGSGSGSTLVPFIGVPSGVQDGVNQVFTLTNNGVPLTTTPTQVVAWNNYPLIPGVGFTVSGVTVIYSAAPATTDHIWAQGFIVS